MDNIWYYWANGISFKRANNHTVLIQKDNTIIADIPMDEWLSIVAAMSGRDHVAYPCVNKLYSGNEVKCQPVN